MHWGSLAEFFAMGGHAGYVWGAYGVTTVLIVVEIWSLRAGRRGAVREVARRVRGGASES